MPVRIFETGVPALDAASSIAAAPPQGGQRAADALLIALRLLPFSGPGSLFKGSRYVAGSAQARLRRRGSRSDIRR